MKVIVANESGVLQEVLMYVGNHAGAWNSTPQAIGIREVDPIVVCIVRIEVADDQIVSREITVSSRLSRPENCERPCESCAPGLW